PLGQAGRRQARARAMDRRWPSDTLAGTGGDQLAGARQGPTPGRETPRRTREAPEVTSWPARARPCRHRRAARRLRGHLQRHAHGRRPRRMPAWPAGGIHPWGYADTHPSIHIYMCICTRIPPRHLHGDPAADIGRARAPCRSERWAARAEGTGGQAGAGFEGRPALRARDGASDQVPLRPKQRANLRGPLCMGARANARTTPYRMGPPPARSGPGNVCTHDHGPVEVGGSMWKARAASPLVAFPQLGLASGTGAVAHPSRGFYSRAAGAQRPWSGRPGCRRGSERPAMGAPVTPETCDGRPSRGRFVLCLKTPGSPHRWDDRSPGAVWSPAPMESVDRWPLASPDTQIPGGRSDGITCVRTGSEGLQWGQLDGRRRSPGAPGAVGAAGRRMSPLLDSPTYTPPLRGLVGPARSAPFARWSAGAGAHQLVPITSLPFVHTARRYYRLNGSVRPSDWLRGVGNDSPEPESEPAEGSLPSEGPLGPTSHPCLSYLVASAGPPFRRPPGRPCAPGPAPAEDPNMNAVLK
ncbi:hypothetical protein KXX30_007249, partial [Aspergillus fumigatus]